MDQRSPRSSDAFLLWVDAVGGYWVCLSDAVTLGQPVRGGCVDVPILGDISSRHARIRRDGEGYLIEAMREVCVDGRPVRGTTHLTEGSRIQLGRTVRMIFRRPHALSATARLDFDSPHRTAPSTDAVLLMADNCVLGPKSHSHVVCRDWPREVIIYRHEEELYCRTVGTLEVDGIACRDQGRITRNSHVAGQWFSLTLEALK